MREIRLSGLTSGVWKRSMGRLLTPQLRKGWTRLASLTHRATPRLYLLHLFGLAAIDSATVPADIGLPKPSSRPLSPSHLCRTEGKETVGAASPPTPPIPLRALDLARIEAAAASHGR
jgi:hypothetical protein